MLDGAVKPLPVYGTGALTLAFTGEAQITMSPNHPHIRSNQGTVIRRWAAHAVGGASDRIAHHSPGTLLQTNESPPARSDEGPSPWPAVDSASEAPPGLRRCAGSRR